MLYSPIWEEYENVCSATMFIFAEMSLKSSEGNMPTLYSFDYCSSQAYLQLKR